MVGLTTEVQYTSNMYEGLIKANPPGSVEPFGPALATSWKMSSDGKVWTFRLRKGVTFHDGTPFNAAAVKYSIDATKALGQGSSYMLGPIKSVQVVDDDTVKVVLTSAVPFERIMSGYAAVLMFSPATKGKSGAWWQGRDAGTGPYMVKSFTPGEQMVFAQNPDWWGGWKSSQFKKVVVAIVSEPGTERQMLQAGSVDFIADLSPWNNAAVRRALAYAVPYHDCVDVGTNGMATVSRGLVPVGLFPYDSSLPQYSYDLEKAKQLLSDAGYPNGQGVPTIQMTYPSEAFYQAKFVPLIKEAWGKLGLNVELQPMPVAQYCARAVGPKSKRADIMDMPEWPSYNDGYDLLYYQFHTQPLAYNFSYWSSPETDRLMDTAYATEATDLAKSQELYNECQRILIDQIPSIPLFDLTAVYAANASLQLGDGALNQYYPGVLFWDQVSL